MYLLALSLNGVGFSRSSVICHTPRKIHITCSPGRQAGSNEFSRCCQPSWASPSRILAPAFVTPSASWEGESFSVFLLHHEQETTNPVPGLSLAWLQAGMGPGQLMTTVGVP